MSGTSPPIEIKYKKERKLLSYIVVVLPVVISSGGGDSVSQLWCVLSVASLTQLVIESVGRYQQEVATPHHPHHHLPSVPPTNRTSNNTKQTSEILSD